jgi:hypothetical protein
LLNSWCVEVCTVPWVIEESGDVALYRYLIILLWKGSGDCVPDVASSTFPLASMAMVSRILKGIAIRQYSYSNNIGTLNSITYQAHPFAFGADFKRIIEPKLGTT